MMFAAWPNNKAGGMQLSEPIILVVSTFMLTITIIFYGLSSADNSDNYGFKLNLKEYYQGIKCSNDSDDDDNYFEDDSDYFEDDSDYFEDDFDYSENDSDCNSTYSDGYPVQITPPMWGYAVAVIFVFIWQLVWLLYSWSFLFRPRVPKVIPLAAHLLFSTALALIILRLYLNANHHVNPGLASQILLTALLICSLALAHFMMYYRTFQLQQEGWVMDKWLTRILVHNGLALLIAWEMVELMLNINITMHYNSGKTVKLDVASSIVLVAYVFVITVWLILETCILDQFMRYTVSIYPVFIWYLMTTLIKQWDHRSYRQSRNNSFLAAALGYTVTIQVCRGIFLLFFRMSRPLNWPQPRQNLGHYQRIQHLQY